MQAKSSLFEARYQQRHTTASTLPQQTTRTWVDITFYALLSVALMMFLTLGGSLEGAVYTESQEFSFLRLNELLNSLIKSDDIWIHITNMGDAIVLFPILALAISFRPEIARALVCTIPIGALFSIVGKELLEMPRPASVIEPSSFHLIGEAITSHTSLPSGHSITVFAGIVAVLATLTSEIVGRVRGVFIIACCCVAFVVCLSRVAVGAHWPMDIFLGAALGALAGALGAHLSYKSALLLSTQFFYRVLFWALLPALILAAGYRVLDTELPHMYAISLVCAVISMRFLYAKTIIN